VILDELKNCEPYRRLGERFAAGFDYLRSTDLAATPDGRYEIVGKDVFAIVQAYDAKPREAGRWEAHRQYADIQYLVSGRELMAVIPLSDSLAIESPYDSEKDLMFYRKDGWPGQLFIVGPGEFAVFLPHDVHMPSMAAGTGAALGVKKCVIKVRV
jgi:biofilm protein TabA